MNNQTYEFGAQNQKNSDSLSNPEELKFLKENYLKFWRVSFSKVFEQNLSKFTTNKQKLSVNSILI